MGLDQYISKVTDIEKLQTAREQFAKTKSTIAEDLERGELKETVNGIYRAIGDIDSDELVDFVLQLLAYKKENPDETVYNLYGDNVALPNEVNEKFTAAVIEYDHLQELTAELVDTEYAYFRKVNSLQNYFEKHHDLQNLDEIIISENDIENILAAVNKVLDAFESDLSTEQLTHIAEQTFPTTSGFFYGSTDYDEYYREDLENIKSVFDRMNDEILESTNTTFIYSSWY